MAKYINSNKLITRRELYNNANDPNDITVYGGFRFKSQNKADSTITDGGDLNEVPTLTEYNDKLAFFNAGGKQQIIEPIGKLNSRKTSYDTCPGNLCICNSFDCNNKYCNYDSCARGDFYECWCVPQWSGSLVNGNSDPSICGCHIFKADDI